MLYEPQTLRAKLNRVAGKIYRGHYNAVMQQGSQVNSAQEVISSKITKIIEQIDVLNIENAQKIIYELNDISRRLLEPDAATSTTLIPEIVKQMTDLGKSIDKDLKLTLPYLQSDQLHTEFTLLIFQLDNKLIKAGMDNAGVVKTELRKMFDNIESIKMRMQPLKTTLATEIHAELTRLTVALNTDDTNLNPTDAKERQESLAICADYLDIIADRLPGHTQTRPNKHRVTSSSSVTTFNPHVCDANRICCELNYHEFKPFSASKTGGTPAQPAEKGQIIRRFK